MSSAAISSGPRQEGQPTENSPQQSRIAELAAAGERTTRLHKLQEQSVNGILVAAEARLAENLAGAIEKYPARVTPESSNTLPSELGAAFAKQVFDQYRLALENKAGSDNSSVAIGQGVILGAGVRLGGQPPMLDKLDGLNAKRRELSCTVNGVEYTLQLDSALDARYATFETAKARSIISSELGSATSKIAAVKELVRENARDYPSAPFQIKPDGNGGFELTIRHGYESPELGPISVPTGSASKVLELLGAVVQEKSGSMSSSARALIVELESHSEALRNGEIKIGNAHLTLHAADRHSSYEKIISGVALDYVPVDIGQAEGIKIQLGLEDGQLSGMGKVSASPTQEICFRFGPGNIEEAQREFLQKSISRGETGELVLSGSKDEFFKPPLTFTSLLNLTVKGSVTVRPYEPGTGVSGVKIVDSGDNQLSVCCCNLGSENEPRVQIKDVELVRQKGPSNREWPALVIAEPDGIVRLDTPALAVGDIGIIAPYDQKPRGVLIVESPLAAGPSNSPLGKLLLDARSIVHLASGRRAVRSGGLLGWLGLGDRIRVTK